MGKDKRVKENTKRNGGGRGSALKTMKRKGDARSRGEEEEEEGERDTKLGSHGKDMFHLHRLLQSLCRFAGGDENVKRW